MKRNQVRNKILSIISLLLLLLSISFSQTHHDWTYNLNIYEVNVRQYTQAGTFAAFETHLERLQEMGIGILWFMPIHPIGAKNRLGSLGSYYSVKDYYGINPEYGNLDDFKSVVDKAHALGMYVIIGWVPNHTAWDNPLTTTNSDWYSKDNNGNFIRPSGTNWSDVIDLDYSKQGLRDYMIDAMKYWINEADIDGFRFDAADMVPSNFWEPANAKLKSLKPNIFLLAEGDSKKFQNIGFDMSYAWGLHGFNNGILKRIANRSSNVSELDDYIKEEQNDYSPDFYRLYFTSNHDENSWQGTVFEQFGDATEVFAVLTSTLDGMPLIYSGQEAGLNKRLKFFDKDQIQWKNHKFSSMYTILSNLKKENKALWNGEEGGDIQRVKTLTDNDIFTFIREKDDDKVFVVLNLCPNEKTIMFLSPFIADKYEEVFFGDTISFSLGSSMTLSPWDYRVYKKSSNNTKIKDDIEHSAEFLLCQNYPNPFNQNTRIQYYLPKSGRIELVIHNCNGDKIKTLISGNNSLGFHTISWDCRNESGEDVSSGIYFYHLLTEDITLMNKMILLR